MARVRPLALWLGRRYGVRPAAKMVGMSFSGFSQVAYSKKKKRVTPRFAQRIATLVLEHKKKMPTLATFDTEPIRVLPTETKKQMLKRVAEEKARWRMPAHNLPESIYEEWLDLRMQGWSYSAIGRRYKRNHHTVKRALDRRGAA